MPDNTANHGLLCFAIWIYVLLLVFASLMIFTFILSHYRVCDGRGSEPAAFELSANLSCSGYSSVAESIARPSYHFQVSEYTGVRYVFSFRYESPCVGSAKILLHGY